MAEMTPADVGAVMGNRGYDDGYNSWIWIIVILFAFWGRNNNDDYARESTMTSEFTQRDIAGVNQNIFGSTQGLQESICGLKTNVLDTKYDLGTQILENRFTNQLAESETQKDILLGNAGINQNILLGNQTIASQMAQCCCDIKEAVHAEGEATRNQMQNDKIEELRESLNTTANAYNNLTLANNIINALRPPVPPFYGYTGCGATIA